MSITMNASRSNSLAIQGQLATSAIGGERAAPSLGNDLRALRQISVRMRFARNEMIFSEGDSAKYAYKVISGAVRLCKHVADGRRQIADFAQEGDFFGFMQCDTHNFTAEAVSDVILLSYPRNQIEQLGETNPELRKHVLGLLSQNIAAMQDHLVILGRRTARERVAAFLLRLAERTGIDEGERLDLAMGRQDIADHLGLTIETVCRVISEFKRQAIVTVPNLNQVILNNVSALRASAEADN